MKSFAFALSFAAIVSQVYGHGLITKPKARQYFCGIDAKPDSYSAYPQCADAFFAPGLDRNAAYNYMSMATHNQGYLVEGKKKWVCSYESDFFKNKTWTDVAINWPTNAATAGSQWFTWSIQWGPHFDDTSDFAMWITKSDFVWDPTKELSFDDFETTPFCLEKYDDKKPTANPNVVADKTNKISFDVKCTVPARSGHHVIKGEWGRTPPTYERFHSCVDMDFGGAVVTSPKVSPSPSPSPIVSVIPSPTSPSPVVTSPAACVGATVAKK
ncbi:hypothetical protein HK098_005991 [Nowakowskiella sp. JEL0407]|nr:hypothetical protein HK098_005991 [Nowakowskiella sp. JEL0407]